MENTKLNFATWLDQELNYRGWSMSELARKAGISKATVSKIISMQSFASEGTCLAIAQAFDYPIGFVFEKAGYPPPVPAPKRIKENIAAYKFDDLTDSQLEEVIQFIEFIKDRDTKKSVKYRQSRKHRQGEIPADLIQD